jgi:L-2,4-diaminobutyrate decarboxylase
VLPEAALADLLSAFMNNGVGVYEMGSPTVAMERAVIKELAGRLGFESSADGILTSGGTLGNLTALLAARQIKGEGDIWKEGTGNSKYAFLVSEQAHYCIDRAVKIMGWGEEGIITVPVDSRYRMDTGKLADAYQSAQRQNKTVLGVVGSACSTATGSFDPLDEIADFCGEHDLWFHVDAAHGGAAAYSGKYRPLLKGIPKADSVIVDFHKMMMCPALVTGLVFKNPSSSYRTFAQKASYLWDKEEHEWFNLGKRTFECTKDMMALKVFTMLSHYGPGLFEEIVNRLFDLGKTFAAAVKKRDNFELAVEPESNIVCFRHMPEGVSDGNSHNRAIRRKLIDKGNSFIVQTEIQGKLYLRTTLMNVFTQQEHIEELLQEVEELSDTITRK